jgi:MraZ protein
MSFIGEYTCKIDSKGRLLLPSKLRAQIPEEAVSAMVINRGFEKCLVLYTKADWKKETEKLDSLNEFNRQSRKFIRAFNNGATLVPIDSLGRLLIPKKLMEYASLKAGAIINAYGSKIEIWDKATYEDEINMDAEEFALQAEQLLGTNSSNTQKDED